MSEVEIFTPTGVLAGSTSHMPLCDDGPDLTSPLEIEDGRWYPLDGSQPTHQAVATVDPDDILLIVTKEPELKVHMAWYSVALEVGPYRLSARLATHPGFDPARALARPGGTFIAVSDAMIELVGAGSGAGSAGSAGRAYVHVNRYAVDRVTSTLMLGHFFPGAHLIAQEATLVG